MKNHLVVFAWFIICFTCTNSAAQDINNELKAAIKADRSLQWKAVDLYQKVLDNPDFFTLTVAQKLNVFDILCRDYNWQSRFDLASRPCTESVRLRDTATLVGVKKGDRYYVSNESIWYIQAVRLLAENELKMGKLNNAQITFKRAFEAYNKFNKGDVSTKWEILVGWGRSYYLEGNFEEAAPLYESAAKIEPAFYRTHFIKAEALADFADILSILGKFKRSENLFQEAVQIMNAKTYTVTDRKIKEYDDVRLRIFDRYARHLRTEGHESEAVSFEAKAKAIRDSY